MPDPTGMPQGVPSYIAPQQTARATPGAFADYPAQIAELVKAFEEAVTAGKSTKELVRKLRVIREQDNKNYKDLLDQQVASGRKIASMMKDMSYATNDMARILNLNDFREAVAKVSEMKTAFKAMMGATDAYAKSFSQMAYALGQQSVYASSLAAKTRIQTAYSTPQHPEAWKRSPVARELMRIEDERLRKSMSHPAETLDLLAGKTKGVRAAGESQFASRIMERSIETTMSKPFLDAIKKSPLLSEKLAGAVTSGKGFFGGLGKYEELTGAGKQAGGLRGLGTGLAGNMLGSIPAALSSMTGIGTFMASMSSVAMTWGVLGKIAMSVISAADYSRRMTSYGASITGMSGYNPSNYARNAQFGGGLKGIGAQMMNVGYREYAESAFKQYGASGTLGGMKDSVVSAHLLAATRIAVQGNLFGKSMDEAASDANRLSKIMGPEKLEQSFRTLNLQSRRLGMDFKDVEDSMGNVVDLGARYGEDVVGNYLAALASMPEKWTASQKKIGLGAMGGLMNAPVTYQAGIAMAAEQMTGGKPGSMLMNLQGKGGMNAMAALSESASTIMKPMIDQIENSKSITGPMKDLYKAVAYGQIYKSENLTRMFLAHPEKMGQWAEAQKSGPAGADAMGKMMKEANTKYMDEALNVASKQVGLLEKISRTLDIGINAAMDWMSSAPMVGTGRAYTKLATDTSESLGDEG